MKTSWTFQRRGFLTSFLLLSIGIGYTQEADLYTRYKEFIDTTTITREKVENFVRNIENQTELLSIVNSEMTSLDETNARKRIYNAIHFLGTLALIGQDDVKQYALQSIINNCYHPNLITGALGILDVGASSNTQDLLDALGEIGNEAAILCLIEGTKETFWKNEALPAGNQKWPTEDLYLLVRNAFGQVYFLQSKHFHAIERVDEIRTLEPVTICDQYLINDLQRYDEGALPKNALMQLGLFEAYRLPFFRHPAVDVYLERLSSCSEWEIYR